MAILSDSPYLFLVPLKKDHDGGSPGFPSRADVIDFVKRERLRLEQSGAGPTKIGKREIARAFGLRGAERVALKRLLKELEADGLIERRRKAFETPGRLGAMVVAEINRRDADGEFLAEPVEWDETHGAPPKILVERPRGRTHAPAGGLGDRVLMRVRPLEDPEDGVDYSGRVVKILERSRTRMLGVFRADPRGGGRLLAVDRKSLNRDVVVPPGAESGAQDGELVAVDLSSARGMGRASARVRERFGSVLSEKAASLIALKKHGAPDQFSAAALAEAAGLDPVGMRGREDWRDIPFVTIDPPDARDHDDAVQAEPDPDPANKGGYILRVAIADVAAYVRPGGALDREALDRGNSIYFPGRVVPMLPERISNDLCSLREGDDRPALALRIVINREGRKLRHSVHRAMIRSSAKLSYEQAQAQIDGAAAGALRPAPEISLRPLWAAYACLKIAREKRGPLALDLPERKIVLRDDGAIDRVITPPRLEAHRLIEEFMILANVAAAESLEERRSPLLYRVHDEPTFEKINDLSDFLRSIGIKLPKGQVLKPAHFNAALALVAGAAHESLVNESILRAQAQAEYSARNIGHFGLSLRRYAHFTSPIRRYADLIVHRALIRALGLGPDGLPDLSPAELEEIAARISAAERRAVAAERETVDRLVASFLADRIGAIFEGRISGVVRQGLFVKLDETGADGFIPAGSLGPERFHFDEARRSLVGRGREAFRLGDRLCVRLLEAAPFAGALRFELIRGPRQARAHLARDSGATRKRTRARNSRDMVSP